MPRKIIIVRHGQTDYNIKKIMQGHLDIPLNETGNVQAQKVANILKNEKIDVFFSSDLQRALRTVKVVLKHHKKPFHITKLLREKYFGKLQGLSFEEIGEYISKFGEQGNFSFRGREKEFGIETEAEVIERIRQFKKLLVQHKNKTIAIFSHGGFIRRLLIYLGLPKKRVKTMYIPNAIPMVLIKKGSFYVLEE